MNLRDVHIPPKSAAFLDSHSGPLDEINTLLRKTCGVVDFFGSEEEYRDLCGSLSPRSSMVADSARREYGDFQTNDRLARESVRRVKELYGRDTFDLMLEPTCGKGAFILATLCELPEVQRVVGIEIHLPYVYETRFKVLEHFLGKKDVGNIPEIEILHGDIFEEGIRRIAKNLEEKRVLIIGNPPWVTSSELGSLDSDNLPRKSNFKRHSGIEAITGKGNFDIGEFILLDLLRNFQRNEAVLGLLVKNSVVKNVLHAQREQRLAIGRMHRLGIDSKKEFDVSVEACLFTAQLGIAPEFTCTDGDFYAQGQESVFGWLDGHFVRSVDDYGAVHEVEGRSPFEWRQGVKHDCSRIMELERRDGMLVNALGEAVDIEPDLVFGLLKSSDLKGADSPDCRKCTIITQQRIGQDTAYIRHQHPKTFAYLDSHREAFAERRSSIYRGKPAFSIFGIGDYSFAPYKVAVSGLYKTTHFTLVTPLDGRPVMLDDTCYFIGFDNEVHARIAHFLLNSAPAQQFLRAIIFPDSKRPISKDVLMRMDMARLHEMADFKLASQKFTVSLSEWESFGGIFAERKLSGQTSLF